MSFYVLSCGCSRVSAFIFTLQPEPQQESLCFSLICEDRSFDLEIPPEVPSGSDDREMLVDNLKLLVLYRVMEGMTGRELREQGLVEREDREDTETKMSHEEPAKEYRDTIPHIEEEKPIEDDVTAQPPLQLQY